MKIFSLIIVLFLSAFVFAQEGKHVGAIRSINVSPEADRFSIIIKGEGKLDPNTVVTDNPPRISLDFKNVKNFQYPAVIEAEENSYVYRVRTSLYAKGRDTISRITVELKNPLDYSVSKNKDSIVLALEAAKPSDKVEKSSAKSTSKPTVPALNKKTAPDPNKQTVPSPNNPTTKAAVPFTPPAPPSGDIVIGSEDLLEVSVFELPQFNTTARVQGDGTITMPLVGSVEVRGLKKQEVEAKIASALQAKYVNNANVAVNVKEYKSRQVSVLGEVKSPGAYYIMSQRTLLQLLSEAGGLSPSAGNRCFIFRSGQPKIEINLRDLMVNGNPELNIVIYPGDVVNIPPDVKIVIYVMGAVRNPGPVQLSNAMPITLLAAIAAAGGPTEAAKQSGIKIRRKGAVSEEDTIKANLKDILKGKIADIPLYEGDVVTVPESFF